MFIKMPVDISECNGDYTESYIKSLNDFKVGRHL